MLSLTLSALALAGLAAVLPFLFGWLLPEGTGWLLVNAVLSAVLLMGSAMGYFVVAYAGGTAAAVPQLMSSIGQVPCSAWHFVRLGALSALIWLPVLVLALAAQPGRWKEKVW